MKKSETQVTTNNKIQTHLTFKVSLSNMEASFFTGVSFLSEI
jgi:hypothetical protein